jgi:hypothetical protein
MGGYCTAAQQGALSGLEVLLKEGQSKLPFLALCKFLYFAVFVVMVTINFIAACTVSILGYRPNFL